ncbi:MAG: hypothetical protein KBC46_03570 [Ferrovibrio sp.]|nr:hypothetical protein [Ferrovibrio sp.]
MTTQTKSELDQAKAVLFGEDGLRASNFKLFPGSSRDVTSEQMGQEINKSLDRIGSGNFEVVETFED